MYCGDLILCMQGDLGEKPITNRPYRVHLNICTHSQENMGMGAVISM